MKKIITHIVAGIFVVCIFMIGFAWGEMKHVPSAGESKVEKGIKATLKVTPSKNMVDLIIEDVKTGRTITEANVNAKIQLPDGSHVEKKLTRMKMGEVFSFMNSLDMRQKGTYHFEIFVKSGDKDIRFNFEHYVK